jgi:hypothetical protein
MESFEHQGPLALPAAVAAAVLAEHVRPLALPAAVAIAVLAKVIWELALSPLARQRIPGPKLAAVSNAWFEWVTLRFHRTASVHDLFDVCSALYHPVSGSTQSMHSTTVLSCALVLTAWSSGRRPLSRSSTRHTSSESRHSTRTSPSAASKTAFPLRSCIKCCVTSRADLRTVSDPVLHAKFRRWNSPAFRGESMRSAGRLLQGEMIDVVTRIQSECKDGQYLDIVAFFPVLTLNV